MKIQKKKKMMMRTMMRTMMKTTTTTFLLVESRGEGFFMEGLHLVGRAETTHLASSTPTSSSTQSANEKMMM